MVSPVGLFSLKEKKKSCKQNKTNWSLSTYVKFKATLEISLYDI